MRSQVHQDQRSRYVHQEILSSDTYQKACIMDTTTDGNCFYHALYLLVFGNEGLMKTLRLLEAADILLNEAYLQEIISQMGEDPEGPYYRKYASSWKISKNSRYFLFF